MGKRYENSPIIEAICEFRLPPDTKWDLTIPGLIYEKIKNEYPDKEQRLFHEVEATRIPEGIIEGRIGERIIFRTNDKLHLIQIGRNLMAVNCYKPYPTWGKFKPRIENAFNALFKTIDFKNLQRIGLRYINRIDIPEKTPRLENYFKFRPFMGKDLPQNIKSFIVGCLFPFSNERDTCRLQFTSLVPKDSETATFLLDLDYYLDRPLSTSVDGALEWIEQAHQQVEEIFEACIGDHLRLMFKEIG